MNPSDPTLSFDSLLEDLLARGGQVLWQGEVAGHCIAMLEIEGCLRLVLDDGTTTTWRPNPGGLDLAWALPHPAKGAVRQVPGREGELHTVELVDDSAPVAKAVARVRGATPEQARIRAGLLQAGLTSEDSGFRY
jgi:hypothetical protein